MGQIVYLGAYGLKNVQRHHYSVIKSEGIISGTLKSGALSFISPCRSAFIIGSITKIIYSFSSFLYIVMTRVNGRYLRDTFILLIQRHGCW